MHNLYEIEQSFRSNFFDGYKYIDRTNDITLEVTYIMKSFTLKPEYEIIKVYKGKMFKCSFRTDKPNVNEAIIKIQNELQEELKDELIRSKNEAIARATERGKSTEYIQDIINDNNYESDIIRAAAVYEYTVNKYKLKTNIISYKKCPKCKSNANVYKLISFGEEKFYPSDARVLITGDTYGPYEKPHFWKCKTCDYEW